MSASLVLSLSERGCPFSYVGGKSRSKDGLGVVLNGQEKMLFFDNPWDALAVRACRDAKMLFNRCRFMSVCDLAEQTARRTERHRPYFEALRHLAEGYYSWDNFQYARALNPLKRGESQLRSYASASPSVKVRRFHQEVRENIPILEAIESELITLGQRNPSKNKPAPMGKPAEKSFLVIDLVANAKRRAAIEYKFDDAVSRLYSAIEKIAKYRLLVNYGIENSDVDLAKVPAALKEEMSICANPRANGKIQIPLFKSYELLSALDDPLGRAFRNEEPELYKILSVRNTSLLAHGFMPVGEDTYQKLLNIVLTFLGMEEKNLPTFPVLDFEGEVL